MALNSSAAKGLYVMFDLSQQRHTGPWWSAFPAGTGLASKANYG